jgi:exosome complex RNA-binding protein Csl4
MRSLQRSVRIGATVLALVSAAGCSGTGGLGSVLGSVLGGAGGQQQGNQVSGIISGVDTRNRQIGIQQQNGQVVGISYDQNTQVVYQNQSYPVTALENGDQVTLRLQQTQNGGYYTDLVQVDQSVRNTSGGSIYQSGNVQQIEGNVRSVNRQQGYFVINTANGGQISVQLANQVSRNDVNRFNSLRAGDYVRFYGVYTGNSNVELRQFQ